MSGFNMFVDAMEILLFSCVVTGFGFVLYIFFPPFKKLFDKLVHLSEE